MTKPVFIGKWTLKSFRNKYYCLGENDYIVDDVEKAGNLAQCNAYRLETNEIILQSAANRKYWSQKDIGQFLFYLIVASNEKFSGGDVCPFTIVEDSKGLKLKLASTSSLPYAGGYVFFVGRVPADPPLDPKLRNCLGIIGPYSGDATMWNRFGHIERENTTPGLTEILATHDCSGIDLTGVDLSGGVDFSGKILHGADLTGAIITDAKLDGADLTNAVLTEADLSGASLDGTILSGATMIGTDFSRTDTTCATFSTPAAFSNDPTQPRTNFTRARVNFETLGLNWSCLNLTQTDVHRLPVDAKGRSQLQGLKANHAVFAQIDLPNANLDQASFSSATLNCCDLSGASCDAADMSEAALDDCDLSMSSMKNANLTGAAIGKTCKLNQAHLEGTVLTGAHLEGVVLAGAHLARADLSNCHLRRAHLEGAHLCKAKLVGTLLNGANLNAAHLEGADLSGSQMGSIARAFKVTTQTDVQTLKAALGKRDLVVIKSVFSKNGCTLRGNPKIEARDRMWTVTDSIMTYQVRVEATANGVKFIGVYTPCHPATLIDAFLKDAILTDANMYGITADGAHLYGTVAMDGAILENARLVGANLGGINLQKSILSGIVLSRAVLTNAKLMGAVLSQADLSKANLENSDFTGANLAGAILTDAAIAVSNTADPSVSNGVWLFDTAGDDPSQYIAELEAVAQNQFTLLPSLQKHLPKPEDGEVVVDPAIIGAFKDHGVTISGAAKSSAVDTGPTWLVTDGDNNYRIVRGFDDQPAPALVVQSSEAGAKPFAIAMSYEADLNDGPVDDHLKDAFTQHGVAQLSAKASVTKKGKPTVWQIANEGHTFTLWLGFDPSQSLSPTIFVRPSISALRQLFTKHNFKLRWQATVEAVDGLWVVNNDSDNPWDTQLGYVQFKLVHEAKDMPLDVYGWKFCITRQKNDQETEYHLIDCMETKLEHDLSSNTQCPNGETVTGNEGLSFAQWMRAHQPPAPPTCVPSGNYYCPLPKNSVNDQSPKEPRTPLAGSDDMPGS